LIKLVPHLKGARGVGKGRGITRAFWTLIYERRHAWKSDKINSPQRLIIAMELKTTAKEVIRV
jgi:hypothetical protein